MYLIMLGAQGTGKGTVAGILAKETGWPQISTGDIFRKNISEKTELGIEADKYISQGNLVPDEKYAMAAVIGLKASIIEEMCNKKIMEGKFVVPANYNYSGQIVISGNEETIEECIEEFKEKGAKKVIKLKTSGPFHTIKLQKASEEFAKCLQNVQFNEPKVDIIKNLDGRIYSKEDNINQILEKHIISPVRFDKAIDLMKDIGIDAYVEIGPGKALSGFVKRELEDANVYTLNNLDSLNKFLENFE